MKVAYSVLHRFIVVKLPALVRSKSINHTRLEEALQKNRETVLAVLPSLSNTSLVKQLREEASRLTRELTQEIQREYREERE